MSREPRSTVLIVDADHRHRKMLAHFVARLGRRVLDVAGFDDPALQDLGVVSFHTALVHADAIAVPWTDVVDHLHHRFGDISVYLVAEHPEDAPRTINDLPLGTLLLPKPINLRSLQVALINSDMIYARHATARKQRGRVIRHLEELQEQILHQLDPLGETPFGDFFAFVNGAARHLVGSHGLAVLERRGGGSMWRVMATRHERADALPNAIRDAEGRLEAIVQSGQPAAERAGSQAARLPGLAPLLQDHVMWVPQALQHGGRQFLWVLTRPAREHPFHTWDLDEMAEFAHLTKIALQWSLVYRSALGRLASLAGMDDHAADAESMDELLETWAQDAATSAGADGYLLRMPGGRRPVTSFRPTDIPPDLVTQLDAECRDLGPGELGAIDLSATAAAQTIDGHGVLAALMPQEVPPSWLLLHFRHPPQPLELAVARHAVPVLKSALQRRLTDSATRAG